MDVTSGRKTLDTLPPPSKGAEVTLRVNSAEDFLGVALSNPANAELCERLAALSLPQCHLVAGCLFQPIWNVMSGKAAGFGVKDYDVFYFDGRDLSWEAEDEVIQRVGLATRELGVVVEVKNQARVHLWYERKFGQKQREFGSVQESIESYLVACTCVGIDVQTRAVHAPFGFEELCAGVLRKNPKCGVSDELFLHKAESYRSRWPWLRVVPP